MSHGPCSAYEISCERFMQAYGELHELYPFNRAQSYTFHWTMEL